MAGRATRRAKGLPAEALRAQGHHSDCVRVRRDENAELASGTHEVKATRGPCGHRTCISVPRKHAAPARNAFGVPLPCLDAWSNSIHRGRAGYKLVWEVQALSLSSGATEVSKLDCDHYRLDGMYRKSWWSCLVDGACRGDRVDNCNRRLWRRTS